MESIAKFEKVSLEEFHAAMKAEPHSREKTDRAIEELYRSLQLPKRSTKGSAGYDFRSPFPFRLPPGESITVPTGIRCRIDEGWVLICCPRSSLGFQYKLRLDNTIAVIDSDYYGAKNEGHILVKLTNNGTRTMEIHPGDRIIQGLFLPYGITYDDDVSDNRTGGLGSTGV